jgi:hypothetical protein
MAITSYGSPSNPIPTQLVISRAIAPNNKVDREPYLAVPTIHKQRHAFQPLLA